MYPVNTNSLRVTSKFGPRTYTYQGKQVSDYHKGIDLVGGSEIVAFADGIVTATCNSGVQYGQACYVRIKHNNGWQTLYYHLKSGSVCVSVGQSVKKGQKLGLMGATGQATGVHLHFQIDKGSSASAVDPYDYIFNGKAFDTSSEPSTPSTGGTTFKVGDKVKFTGTLYRDSAGNGAGQSRTNLDATIYLVKAGAKCPYNINNGLGWVKAESLTSINNYSKGNYKTIGNMNVRSGAGTNYGIKKVSELSADGKKHATSSDGNANAVYKAGTVFTALEIINQNGVWAKTPSGYVCIKGASGTVYCSKI